MADIATELASKCGISPDAAQKGMGAVLEFIKTAKPTYPQFEAWVKKNGTKLDKASIDKLNALIKGYMHADAVRKNILSANGLPDDFACAKDAVNLNNLDDWKEFHEAVLK